jgi:hypothetical protein
MAFFQSLLSSEFTASLIVLGSSSVIDEAKEEETSYPSIEENLIPHVSF